MADIANFAMFHGSRTSSPPVTHVYEPNENVYTYVASAIAIALEAFEQDKFRYWLTNLAMKFAQIQGRHNIFGGNPARARMAVDSFLHRIRENFPKVLIDESTTDPTILGMHMRGPWSGSHDQFNPRDHWVALNAQRVKDMITSSVSGGRPFRTFQFTFAIVFIHEVGAHMLITSLGNGEADTPEGVSAPGFGNQNLGESGRWLELNLYGGTIEFIQDPAQDSKKQPGIPYLINGTTAKRINQSAIDQFCRWEISFPLMTDARSAVHWQTLPRIGVPGSGASSSDLRNAVTHGMQRQMGSLNDTFGRFMSARELPPKVLAGWNVKMSALKRIPMHPKERLTASA